jgi:hypothetical protein
MRRDSEQEHLNETIKDAKKAAAEEVESRPFTGQRDDIPPPEQDHEDGAGPA